MICEYKGCENQAEKTIWNEETGPENPICAVCAFHGDMIQSAPAPALAIEAHVHRTVWLHETAYPGKRGSIN